MKYIKIEWTHNYNLDYPCTYFLEVGDSGFEERKLELYKDGSVKFATETIECGTFLTPKAFGELEAYNYSDQRQTLRTHEITKDEFNRVWKEYINLSTRCYNSADPS